MIPRNNGIARIILIFALAAVAVAAGLGVFMLKGKTSHEPVKLPTSEIALGEFIVNLADVNDVRYLKTDIVLEIEGNAPSGEGDAGGKGDPRIRDAIIEVMSSKRFAELAGPRGKDSLKQDIIAAVNQRMKEDGIKVKEVYFNAFAMQ